MSSQSLVCVIRSDALSKNRSELLQWCKETNALHSRKKGVGGIVRIENEAGRQCFKSLTSGEVRWIPDQDDVDGINRIYEWASDEILCAFEADFRCFVVDSMGSEVLNSEGFDGVLRACVWKSQERGSGGRQHFLVVTKDDIEEKFQSIYMFEDNELEIANSWDEWVRKMETSKRCATRPRKATVVHKSTDVTHHHHGIGTVYSLMKFPVLIITLGIVLFELGLYISIRQLVRTVEGIFSKNRRIRSEMGRVTSYAAWRRLARQLDLMENRGGGTITHIPTIVNLSNRLKVLKDDLLSTPESKFDGEHEIIRCLRECTMSSQNTFINEAAYAMNFSGTNIDVQEYTETILEALNAIDSLINPNALRLKVHHHTESPKSPRSPAPPQSPNNGNMSSFLQSPLRATISALKRSSMIERSESGSRLLEQLQNYEAELYANQPQPAPMTASSFSHQKRQFFSELAHSYGESALCLSGGAANAYYHLGVIQSLLEMDLLPRHVSGASGGALVGAFLCTHTDQEMKELLRPEILSRIFDPCEAGMWQMLSNGVFGTMFDIDEWSKKLQDKICGNLTFREAYERTGRSFTITVYNIDAQGRNHTRCLNYKTTPDVVVYSAVLASSALPKLLPPVELLRKDAQGRVQPYHAFGRFWRDGSFENELPFEALHQLFNASFFLVSQVEPHLIPFFYSNRGAAGESVSHRGGKGWRGGFLLSYFERLLKLDLKKWMLLIRDFHLLPKFMETDISSIFLGRTTGTCTMVAPVIMNSYLNLIRDPDTPEKMQLYLHEGNKMLWPKLGMIRNHMSVERKLMDLAGVDRRPHESLMHNVKDPS